MRAIRPFGPYCDIVEARSPLDHALVVKLGLRSESFQELLHHNLATMVAQYYGIVQESLMDAVHAFRGLNRPLMHDSDMDADTGVVIFSWRPAIDYVWIGGRFGGKPLSKVPPSNRVFVVLVREEPENEFGIFGSIERWNWLREDRVLRHAPIEWKERYSERLWSRNI